MARNLPSGAGEDDEDFPEPPRLRALRRMVMALTAILALGMVVIAGTVAWRLFSATPPAQGISAAALSIPAGREPVALGGAGSELMVWTREADGAERLMVFRRADGRLLSDTPVTRGE